MGLAQNGLAKIRDKGIWTFAKHSFRYAFMWSPASPIIQRTLPDSVFEKVLMAVNLDYWPQFDPPRSFNEKIARRKLTADTDEFARLADKWRVREYVSERVGDGVLNEVYHVTDDPSTIPFSDLPDSFVVKSTHGCGDIHIIDEKAKADYDRIRRDCEEWLSSEFGEGQNEDWYSEIEPQIIIENRLTDEEHDVPLDFKFFVFHGEAKYIQVDIGRFGNHTRNIYDTEWERQDFELSYPQGPDLDAPKQLGDMIDTAESLADGFGFMRVDLYQPDGEEVVFGEMTMAPGSGREKFRPQRYDFEVGSHW